MSKATDLRKQLDQLNADCVALDNQITADRHRLAGMNKMRSELETEFQVADAAEAQAAIDAGQAKGPDSSG